MTQGTLMGDFLVGDMSTYIMSIKARGGNRPTNCNLTPRQEDPETRAYGICFADTGTAEFNLCGFVDDAAHTQLETLLVQVSRLAAR